MCRPRRSTIRMRASNRERGKVGWLWQHDPGACFVCYAGQRRRPDRTWGLSIASSMSIASFTSSSHSSLLLPLRALPARRLLPPLHLLCLLRLAPGGQACRLVLRPGGALAGHRAILGLQRQGGKRNNAVQCKWYSKLQDQKMVPQQPLHGYHQTDCDTHSTRGRPGLQAQQAHEATSPTCLHAEHLQTRFGEGLDGSAPCPGNITPACSRESQHGAHRQGAQMLHSEHPKPQHTSHRRTPSACLPQPSQRPASLCVACAAANPRSTAALSWANRPIRNGLDQYCEARVGGGQRDGRARQDMYRSWSSRGQMLAQPQLRPCLQCKAGLKHALASTWCHSWQVAAQTTSKPCQHAAILLPQRPRLQFTSSLR